MTEEPLFYIPRRREIRRHLAVIVTLTVVLAAWGYVLIGVYYDGRSLTEYCKNPDNVGTRKYQEANC